MTDRHRLAQWTKWSEKISSALDHRLLSKELFLQVQKIIKSNSTLPPSYFYAWFQNAYIADMAIGMRRLIDADHRSVSLRQLISDIERYPMILTRNVYVAKYDKRPFMQRVANSVFDRYAGKKRNCISPIQVRKDLKQLNRKTKKFYRFVTLRIAHSDKKRAPQVTFDDMHRSLEEIRLLVDKYLLLIRGTHYSRDFSLEGDLTDLFSRPWYLKDKARTMAPISAIS